MSGLLIAMMVGSASADPAALRMPTPHTTSVSGVLGGPELSVGTWMENGWGVAVEGRLPGSAFGASAGRRWNLAGGPDRWGVDAFVAGGLVVPTIDPGIGLTLTPSIQAGWRGDRVRQVANLTSPTAIRLNGVEARLPVVLEDWFMVRAGRTWLGVQLGAGAVFSPGGIPAMTVQASAAVSIDLGTTGDYARPVDPRPTPAPRPAPN